MHQFKEIRQFDLIIIGGGLAGCNAALVAAENHLKVAVLSSTHALRSHSVAAQGGINVSSDTVDLQSHIDDTLNGGVGLSDSSAVEMICKNAQSAVGIMENRGALLHKNKDGNYIRRPFGGQSSPRTCFYKDRTGLSLLNTAYEQALRAGAHFFHEHTVFDITLENSSLTYKKVDCWDLNEGGMIQLQSPAVIVASGGMSAIYPVHSNCAGNTGEIESLLFSKGVPLMDLEFVQFHPTGLAVNGILVSEAARGEGGYLVNEDGHRFMEQYDKRMELAPRDIVSRAIRNELQRKDGAVFLDLRHLGRDLILEKLPEIYDIIKSFTGKDASKELIPVAPTAHYSMGGVPVSLKGEVVDSHLVAIPGLFACGECSCMSLHGANRLGGNSLLEAVVTGLTTGCSVLDYLGKGNFYDQYLESTDFLRCDFYQNRKSESAKTIFKSETSVSKLANSLLFRLGEVQTDPKIESHCDPSVLQTMSRLRDKIADELLQGAGIVRQNETLVSGLVEFNQIIKEELNAFCGPLSEIKENKLFNYVLSKFKHAHHPVGKELISMRSSLLLAPLITAAALDRQESRGAHFRSDYPKKNESHGVHSLLYIEGNEIKLKSIPVEKGVEND